MKPFGWRGIETEVPETWELCRHSGDATIGELALDDGESVRLRIQWRAAPPKLDLDTAVERYRRALAKKGAEDFEVLPNPATRDAGGQPNGTDQPEQRQFRWVDEGGCRGAFQLCRACRRLISLEALFAREAEDPEAAARIIASLRDHRPDARRFWAVYGLAFLCPDDYNLARANLLPGRLQFLFRRRRREWLRVERWGMAKEWLKKAPLETWPAELGKLAGGFRAKDLHVRTRAHAGHDTYMFSGAVGRSWLRRGQEVNGVLWHDIEDDRILVVWGGGASAELIEEIGQSVTNA